MGNLSKNLSRSEFVCNCGCGLDTVDIKTVEVIQDVCEHFDSSVIINSGCRCYEYNRQIGSNDRSQHPRCRAADCNFTNATPFSVYRYLIEKYHDKYGFGVYNTFVHIDTRTNGPARWDERTEK